MTRTTLAAITALLLTPATATATVTPDPIPAPAFFATSPAYIATITPGDQPPAPIDFTPAETHCYTWTGRPIAHLGTNRWVIRTSQTTWRLIATYNPTTRTFTTHARTGRIHCAAWRTHR